MSLLAAPSRCPFVGGGGGGRGAMPEHASPGEAAAGTDPAVSQGCQVWGRWAPSVWVHGGAAVNTRAEVASVVSCSGGTRGAFAWEIVVRNESALGGIQALFSVVAVVLVVLIGV